MSGQTELTHTKRQRSVRKQGGSLSKSIYEEIRERICLLRYPPGDVLREAELAEEFGVSRTPIRQVFQKLEIDGLVETRNGVGTIVTGFDFVQMKDVYELRLKLAELIAQLSPKPCSDFHRSGMEQLLNRAAQLKGSRDTGEFWRINHERQKIIASLIGNTALRDMYDQFYYQTGRVWFQMVDVMWDDQVEALCAELRDLIRAMELGDTQAVAYVERNHLSFYMGLIGRFISGELPKADSSGSNWFVDARE
ncbi:MAG: GntR family transcriptional regulator [Phyllobacteriaceae bacterium]|jgi:DNA-binding GntR family transcriptional regulator|nr:GntR family transcriptional regulator [Phyllobacteriaceae bacterium]